MMKEINLKDLKELLRDKLDEYRLNHSLCVADEAVRLAEKYGFDKDKAYLAGLLHDITKNRSANEHLKILDSFDIILSDIEKKSPQLWHAITGAGFVNNILKIEDSDIIDAIRYHTTAKADMSLLSKIIYVADFTSSDRSYPDVQVMRDLSNVSLESAMEYALKYTIDDLSSKNRTIHPDTLDAYNFLISNKSEGSF